MIFLKLFSFLLLASNIMMAGECLVKFNSQEKLLQEEIMQVVVPILKAEVKREIMEESLKNKNMFPSMSTMTKALVIVAGGGYASYVFSKWLSKHWATPQNLAKKDDDVNKHLSQTLKKYSQNQEEGFQEIDGNVGEIKKNVAGVVVAVQVVGNNFDVMSLFNQKKASAFSLKLRSNQKSLAQILIENHKQIADHTASQGLFLQKKISELGVEEIADDLRQFGKTVQNSFGHLEENIQLQQQATHETLHQLSADVSSLSRNIESTQEKVTENSENLKRLLLQKNTDIDQLKEILESLSEIELQQKSIIPQLEALIAAQKGYGEKASNSNEDSVD